MDSTLQRATPIVLLVLAGLAWFGKFLPGYDGLTRSFGEAAVLRFVTGVLCLYMVMLVLERQRMERAFKDVLGAFRQFHAERAGGGGAAGGEVRTAEDAQEEALRLLVGSLSSPDAKVRGLAAGNLQRLTGQSFGEDAAAWTRWLDQRNSG